MDEIYERSLQELDGQSWGDPPDDATGLIEQVHRLRSVKLRDLTLEDLATLLGQRVGSDWLVPLTLDHLDDDPLAGAFYPGQLLANLLRLTEYWERFPRDLARLSSIRGELVRRRSDIDKVLNDPGWPNDL
jgi:hypothetical protein